MEIHERLTAVRKELGYNASKAADILQMNVSNYHKLEKGIRPIGKNTMGTIVEKFNVNPSWLKTGEGKMILQREQSNEISGELMFSERDQLEVEVRKLKEQVEKILQLVQSK